MPEFVDGDLLELDAETLMRMRSEVAHVDGDPNDTAAAMQRAGAMASSRIIGCVRTLKVHCVNQSVGGLDTSASTGATIVNRTGDFI